MTNDYTNDCGSELSYVVPLECDIDGCNDRPAWRAVGYLHFMYIGVEYSNDGMWLCEEHRDVVESIIGS